MYAGLKQRREAFKNRPYSSMYLEDDDMCCERLYVEAVGHAPPAPQSPQAALQFRYGTKDCRRKDIKGAILAAAFIQGEA